jgi:PTH1 family peptidyl-tRNA hydrolase
MVLIVGLGNPGKKYKNTRHNVGFRTVDEIAANFQFSIFNFQSIFSAEISEGKIDGEKIILAKPRTFMNLSGVAVKSLVRNWKLEIGNLIIIHDDIDLPIGKIKISKGSGSAGHKGVESIIKNLKTKDFIRLRIGVNPNLKIKIQNVENFVLRKFSKNEEKTIKEVIEKTAEAIEVLLKEGIEKSMSLYNC